MTDADLAPLRLLSEKINRHIIIVSDLLKRYHVYGPGDALRDNLARALVLFDDLDAALVAASLKEPEPETCSLGCRCDVLTAALLKISRDPVYAHARARDALAAANIPVAASLPPAPAQETIYTKLADWCRRIEQWRENEGAGYDGLINEVCAIEKEMEAEVAAARVPVLPQAHADVRARLKQHKKDADYGQ